MGALPSLNLLALNNNQIGDVGMQAFSTALGGGALASLEGLDLAANKIGDAGCTALAEVCAGGARGQSRCRICEWVREKCPAGCPRGSARFCVIFSKG